jgi:hypothetical protein
MPVRIAMLLILNQSSTSAFIRSLVRVILIRIPDPPIPTLLLNRLHWITRLQITTQLRQCSVTSSLFDKDEYPDYYNNE